MGDFSLACGATGVSLMNVRVVLIPLLKTRFTDSFESGAHLVTNEGAYHYYHPITLPIFGTLDSYGRLEDIERDANVEFLEKKLGVPIETFAEACSTGLEGDEYEKILTALIGPLDPKTIRVAFHQDHLRQVGVTDKKIVEREAKRVRAEEVEKEKARRRTILRGMIVHRDAWDHMTTTSFRDYDGAPDWSMWDDHYHSFSAATLEFLGFETFKGRGKGVHFKHPDIHGLVAVVDDDVEFRIGNRKETYIHSVESLEKFMSSSKRKGVSKSLPREVRELAKKTPARLSGLMKRLSEGRLRLSSTADYERINDLYGEKIATRKLKPGMSMKDVEHHRKRMKDIDVDPGNRISLDMENAMYYDRKVIHGFFLNALADLSSFTLYLMSINRMYAPTYNGPQYGNFHATKEIAELTARIAGEKIKEREEDE